MLQALKTLGDMEHLPAQEAPFLLKGLSAILLREDDEIGMGVLAVLPKCYFATAEDAKERRSALDSLLTVRGMSLKFVRRGTPLQAGVLRAHIIAPVSGDLLRELYTCDGAGTLICRDM